MLYVIFSSIIFMLDYISKKFIKRKYKENVKVSLYRDKIFIYHMKNNGFAYGLFKKFQKLIYSSGFIILIILLLLFGKSLNSRNFLKKLAYSFAVGGGLANFYDRLQNKNITDFIYIKSEKFKNTPVFNIADLFLFLSPILLFISDIKKYFKR